MSVKPHPPKPKKTGILIIGHGSRASEPTKVLSAVAHALRRRYRKCLVESAFLELNQPDLQAGIDRLMQAGAGRILIVPFAPYLDGQVGRELPDHLAVARSRHAGLEIRIAPHFGYDHRLVAVCSDRIGRALREGRWS